MTATATPPAIDTTHIETKHGDYEAIAKLWKIASDSVEGQHRIKAEKSAYLPHPTGMDDADYKDLLARALWYDAPSRTVDALVGMVLAASTPAAVEMDESIRKDLDVRACTDGRSLKELVHDVLAEALTTSRIGLLVDAPTTDPARALIATYDAEHIWNWRIGVEGKPDLVVLHEIEDSYAADLFKPEKLQRIRVLQMVDGVYQQQTFTKGERDAKWTDGEVVQPAKKGGGTFDEIPFEVVNARKTGLQVERPILMGLFDAAVSWYQNSADLENGRHWCAAPTAVACGFSMVDHKGNPVQLRVGGGNVWQTDQTDASASYLEFTGAGLGHLQQGMEAKQQLMAAIGGRMLEEPKAGVESADALKLRQSGERSALRRVAETVSAGLQRVLGWLCDWRKAGSGAKVKVDLAKDLGAPAIDAATLTTLMGGVQSGLLSWNTLMWNARRGGVIEPGVTDEDEAARIAVGTPGGPSVVPGDGVEVDEDGEPIERADGEADEGGKPDSDDDAEDPDGEADGDGDGEVEEEPVTVNELTLGIERLARIGDVKMANALRQQLADLLAVPKPKDLTQADLAAANGDGGQG